VLPLCRIVTCSPLLKVSPAPSENWSQVLGK
jgi:hypothetical protein